MKFGKEFSSQMIHEWEDAYMDYNTLKKILKKNFLLNQKRKDPSHLVAETNRAGLKRRISLYRAFSGLLTSNNNNNDSFKKVVEEEDVVLVTSFREEKISEAEGGGEGEGGGHYHRATPFLTSIVGDVSDSEFMFFEELDGEFDKVVNFYKKKVDEVLVEAEGLNKQMDAFIALRLRVEDPSIASFGGTLHQVIGPLEMDAISEVEMTEGKSIDADIESKEEEISEISQKGNRRNVEIKGFRPAPLDVLNHVKIIVDPQTPVSTIKAILPTSSGMSFSKVELKKAEQQMTVAFVEFHRKLRLLKRYSFLNQLAFSKIMKKYDKTTSRNASKAYMEMVDKSDLGSSDVVSYQTFSPKFSGNWVF
ncbi:hypothetical protein ACFE04_006463 [Oxalis oulophora]